MLWQWIEWMGNLAAFVPSLFVGGCMLWRRKIMEYTIIGTGFSVSADDVKEAFDKHFKDGKQVADFSSMIGQSAFCAFSSRFLLNKSNDGDLNYLQSLALEMSGFVFFALSVYLYFKISRITLFFFLQDAARNKTPIAKSYPVFMSIFMTACFWYSQTFLIEAIVKANPALK